MAFSAADVHSWASFLAKDEAWLKFIEQVRLRETEILKAFLQRLLVILSELVATWEAILTLNHLTF